jgi:hypothetical protein
LKGRLTEEKVKAAPILLIESGDSVFCTFDPPPLLLSQWGGAVRQIRQQPKTKFLSTVPVSQTVPFQQGAIAVSAFFPRKKSRNNAERPAFVGDPIF